MEKVVLKAIRRDLTGKQVAVMRRNGQLPAVLYGYGIDSTPITLDMRDASRTLGRLTSSSLVHIELDGKEYPTLVREKQRNTLKAMFLHIDFQVVSLTDLIRTNVAIDLSGTSPAVKDFNAVLVTGLDEVEVECLPQNLPERITVDLSVLKKIGDSVHVRDLLVADNVKIMSDGDEMIVLATAAKEEEILEVVETEVAAEPEVIERGKKEEEAEE